MATTSDAKAARERVKMLERRMAERVNRHLGTTIEVTSRGGDRLTLSGRPCDVAKAASLFRMAGYELEGEAHDAELGETFFYLVGPAV